MKYLVPFSVIFIALFSLPSLAFDPIQFEKDQCQQAIVPGSRPGFYSVREPLVFRENGGTAILQKVTYRDETFYIVNNGVKTYQLRSNLKKVRDFVMRGDNLWLIDQEYLIEFDGRGRELNRYSFSQTISKYEKPRGLDIREDELLIAHGSLGLVSFDLRSRQFNQLDLVNTQQARGQRSLAVSVTWVGSLAYVALTGNTQHAFNGVVVYDLHNARMVNASGYKKHRHGVVDPYARLYFYDNSVYMNNGGWIHQLDPNELASKKFTRPKWLPIPFPFQDRNRYLRVRGDFIFQNDEVFGCAIVERTPTLAQRQL